MLRHESNALGSRLKNLRLNSGMTQEILSKKTGVQRPYLSNLENLRSNPEDEMVERILIKGFNIPYDQVRDLIAQWKAEEALSKASNPEKVLKNISNSVVIEGSSFGNNVTIKNG